jgi:precorrin-3B synthase
MPPTPDATPSEPPAIRGWCPGAFAPMASNDGLLIRAKIIGSRASAAQLAAIAATARICGNGLVDLSQRAQLQLRGIAATTLTDALERLDACGLLPRDAPSERITNIVASPLAGLSPSAAFDANALAAELAAALQADAVLRALPAKFLFAIDDGGELPLMQVGADTHAEPAGHDRVAIRLAGLDDRAVLAERRAVVVGMLRIARAFVALRDDHPFELRRMSRLVAALGADALLREAGLAASPFERRLPRARPALLGAHALERCAYAGVAAPFGRWRAADLAALAALAQDHGLGEIRLTPWRALLLPAPTREAAERLSRAAQGLGLIVSDDDPALSVVACPGAPECPQAHGETRAHLARLAPLAQKLAGVDGVGLHVSGCAKGCARPVPAPVTLVAHDGRFDVIDNGPANGAPYRQGLTIDEVECALVARAEKQTCPTP